MISLPKNSGARFLAILMVAAIIFSSVAVGAVAMGEPEITIDLGEKDVTVKLTQVLEPGSEAEPKVYTPKKTTGNGKKYVFVIDDDELPEGTYTLTAEKVGFADYVGAEPVVAADEDVNITVSLEPLATTVIKGKLAHRGSGVSDGKVTVTGYGIDEPVELSVSSDRYTTGDLKIYVGKEYTLSYSGPHYHGQVTVTPAGTRGDGDTDIPVDTNVFTVICEKTGEGTVEITGLDDAENSQAAYGNKNVKIVAAAEDGYKIESIKISDGTNEDIIEFDDADYVDGDTLDVVIEKTLTLNKAVSEHFDFSDGITSDIRVDVEFISRSYILFVNYTKANGGVYTAYDEDGNNIEITENTAKTENGQIEFFIKQNKKLGYKIKADAENGYHISGIWFGTDNTKAFNIDTENEPPLDINRDYNNSLTEYPTANDPELNLTNKNYYLVVKFDKNNYTVQIDNGENSDKGSLNFAEVEAGQEEEIEVEYGAPSNAIIVNEPDGYQLDKVTFSFAEPVGDTNELTITVGEEVPENVLEYIEITEDEGFCIRAVTCNVVITPEFSAKEVITGDWSNYITVSGDNIVEGVPENDPNTLVYKKGAEVTVTPNQDENPDYKFIKRGNRTDESFTVTESESIEKATLVKEGWIQGRPSVRSENIGIFAFAAPLHIVIDETAPVIKNDRANTSNEWTSEGMSLEIETEDPAGENDFGVSSGVDFIVYNVGSSMGADISSLINDENHKITKSDDKFTYLYTGENEETVYFIAVDRAGNKSEEFSYTFRVDKTEPRITGIYYVNSDGEATESIYNLLEFGTMYNGPIKIKIAYSDNALKEVSGGSGDGGDSSVVYEENPDVVTSGVNKLDVYLADSPADGEEVNWEPLDTVQCANGETFIIITIPPENVSIFNKLIAFRVTDKAGNESVLKSPCAEKVDKTGADFGKNAHSDLVFISQEEPKVDIELSEANYDGNGELWYGPQGATATVKASSEELVGLDTVSASFTYGEGSKVDLLGENGKKLNSEGRCIEIVPENETDTDYTFSTVEKLPEGTDGKVVIDAAAIANTKTEASAQKEIYLDITNPEIVGFSAEIKNASKVLSLLTFGIYSNDNIDIIVEVKDLNASSGIRKVVMYEYKEGGENQYTEIGEDKITISGLTELENGNYSITFTVPAEMVTEESSKVWFNKEIAFKVTDNVGNESDFIKPDDEGIEEGKKLSSSKVMVETVKPAVSFALQSDESATKFTSASGAYWTNKARSFRVDISDYDANGCSGLRSVVIKGNDGNVKADQTFNAFTTSHRFENVYTGSSGAQRLTAVVYDNAGNKVEVQSMTINIDNIRPEITKFDFKPEKYVEKNENISTVELKEYGYYFAEDTQVYIYASDKQPSSGLKSILFYTVGADGKESNVQTLPVVSNSYAIATVPAGFKGQIFAKPVDNVGNRADAYVTPDGTIVETQEQHDSADPHIQIDRAEAASKDKDGIDLYSGNVELTVTVTDEFAGIRSVDWSVSSPYDQGSNQSGTANVSNGGGISGDEGWTKNNEDLNLVTGMSKKINVGNNSNAIVVKVTMTDRAGNTSELEDTFSIDLVAPVIKVEYIGKAPDSKYKSTYKDSRFGVITVTERNFDPALVVPEITNTDGVIPVISSWEEHPNNENPDLSYYVAALEYSADGDYVFDISMTDSAGNASADYTPDKFTIDKTIPVISVVYNNNSAQNGYYYAADRTATITIVEHNFDPSRVKITGKATDRGEDRVFPAVSSWSNIGDTHTATIHYLNDGVYTFDISVADMAGNNSAEFTQESFVIDKTRPSLDITGVTELSANNGDVAPVIRFSDTNYNPETVSVTLTGSKNGKVNYPVSVSVNEYGETIVYRNFEKTKNVDDVYYLTVSVMDNAGNITQQTRKFSVNRFGSTYEIGNADHPSINGKYLNAETDVVISEINVNNLLQDKIKVKMYKNSVPYDLVEGRDYTLSLKAPGNTEWSQYTYLINKKLFADDGIYRIVIYSVDKAGNVNENNAESKKSDISFAVDKTAPVIVPVDFESNETYKVDSKTVEVEIKDNIKLDSNAVKVYVDEQEVKVQPKTGEDELFVFTVNQDTLKHNARIIAVDMARNISNESVNNYLVSTNKFALWYNNTKLFIGTIAGGAVLLSGLAFLAIFLVRKKREKDEY